MINENEEEDPDSPVLSEEKGVVALAEPSGRDAAVTEWAAPDPEPKAPLSRVPAEAAVGGLVATAGPPDLTDIPAKRVGVPAPVPPLPVDGAFTVAMDDRGFPDEVDPEERVVDGGGDITTSPFSLSEDVPFRSREGEEPFGDFGDDNLLRNQFILWMDGSRRTCGPLEQ